MKRRSPKSKMSLRSRLPTITVFRISKAAVPEREWLVQRFIPSSNPTLLAGDGGTGKSLIGAQLCTATCLDRPWLGLPVMPGRALYISAEDDEDELQRRFADIAVSEGVRLGELDGITYRSLAGEDAVLAVHDNHTGKLVPTPLFFDIGKTIERIKPVLVVLDAVADLFGGNENDRAQVRQFIGLLRGWCINHRCAVVLLAHPSLNGMNTGSGFSGSTAWNNSVRSRLYFTRDRKNAAGEPPDPDVRTLEVMKANYGAVGESIRVRWKDGVFVSDGEKRMDFISRAAAQNQADEMFLALLHRLAGQGRNVSDATGRNYAPAVFAEESQNGGITRTGFRAAMNRLFVAGKIKVDFEGPPSKRRRFLVTAEVP